LIFHLHLFFGVGWVKSPGATLILKRPITRS